MISQPASDVERKGHKRKLADALQPSVTGSCAGTAETVSAQVINRI